MTTPALPQMPSKPLDRGAASTGSQRDRRFTDTFHDLYRHPRFPAGRPFTGQREFQSGASTESIAAGFLTSDLQCGEYFCENPEMGQTPQERAATLGSAWEAPWLPIAKYWRFSYRSKKITFAYDRLIADESEGLKRYWVAASKVAGENDVIDPDRPLAVPFRIRTLLGSPTKYMGMIRLARAAQAGDAWLMGAVKEPNEELAKILGLDVQYLGASMTSGDAQYVAVQSAPAPAPLITPEQVIATPLVDLVRIVAELSAKVDALSKKSAPRSHHKKARTEAAA